MDLKLVFSNLSGSNVLVLPDAPFFTIVAVSHDYLKATGRNREELIGKGLFEAFPNNPDDPNQTSEKTVRASLEYALTHKEPHHLPLQRYDISKQDGTFEERYWLASNRPVLSEDGSVIYLIHAAEDVTDRLKADQREAQIKSMEKAYHLFMHAPVIIGILKGDDYVIELANEGLLEVWGRGEEVIGRPLLEAIPELERQGFIPLLDQVRTTGDPFYAYGYPITLERHGKAEVLYFDFVYKPFYDDGQSGKAAGVISVGHNVTEQVRTRQKFKNVLEQASDPILILKGEDLVLEVANQALFDLWQVGPDAINKPFLEILPEMKHQGFVELLKKVLHTGEPFYGKEVPAVFTRKNGKTETVYFNFAYQPYREADGSISGVLITANDITGQVLARQQLRKSEQNFRAMVLQAPVAICIFRGPQYILEVVNPLMETMLGRKAAEIQGRPFFDAMPEVRNQGLEQILEGVMNNSTSYISREQVFRLPRKGSLENRYVTYIYEPLQDADGKTSGVIVVATDVTEQVIARKKIEESEQELQKRVKERTADLEQQRALVDSILNASISGIMALDAIRESNGEVVDFTIIKINQQLTRIIGLDESVIGKSYLTLFSSSESNGIFDMYKAVLEKGLPQRMEVFSTNLHLNSWFDISAAKRGDNGIVVNFANISPQREAAIKIEQQKNLLDNILKHSPSGIAVYSTIRDKEGKVVDFQCILANDAAEAFTLIPNRERLAKTVLQVTPELKDSSLFQMAVTAVEAGESFRTQYFRKGIERWLELSVVRMDENHIINVFTDVTTTKQTQLQLEESVENLKRLNAELEQFTYVSHHDLQEPLRKIAIFADLIRSESYQQLSEASQKRFDKITDAASRMSMALRDVLNYASLNTEEQYTTIGLDEVLTALQSDLELLITEKGAKIYADALPTIRAVPHQMHQLFYNLINNALKFTKPGQPPVIHIKCREVHAFEASEQNDLYPGRKYYEIAVSDNGIGFSPEGADMIFGMFKRLHGKQEYAGTGIGLALCKKVVQNHGGKIWAESKVGEGATFKVVLPAE